MEEEIDLRPYIELLIHRWYLIVGAAVLAGLVAFGVTSLMERVYEASALIAVTQERLLARFDPRLDTTEERQPLDALPELASSDEILQLLLEGLEPVPQDIESLHDLRKILEATSGSDPSLIRLSVMHSNPAEAATMANLWAEIFVGTANEIYGDGSEVQLTFFEEQLVEAEEELAGAEADLITFQGINRQRILQNMVESLDESQAAYLADQQELVQLRANVEDLKKQIAETDETDTVSFANQLTALVLQLRTFNPALKLPIQLQIDGESELSGTNRNDLDTFLAELKNTINSRTLAIDQELTELEPRLLRFQGELQEAEAEYNRLVLYHNVAKETLVSVARKVDEERITSTDLARGIQIASRAAAPVEPASRGRVASIIIAAILGAIIISIVLMAVHWWNSDSETTKSLEAVGK